MTAGSPCPVCGAHGFRFRFHEVGHDYEACEGCGFQRMADPRAPAELDSYYLEERQQGEACWQEHEQNVVKYRTMIAYLERWVRPGRFLDVGCSLGTSLVAARERGWQAVGIELSRPVAEFGREKWGLDIRTDHLAGAGFPDASFDLVWMHHTLEHVRDPHEVVAEVRRVLRPGGVMYQALPNHDGLKARIFGGGWSYGVTPEHLSHFSDRTLRLLAQRAGFHVLAGWTRSYREDPRLILDTMRRLGRLPQLMRWCGRADGSFDQEAYIRFLTDRRLAFWLSNRAWPARLVEWLGLGEEAHLVAARD